MKKSKNFKRQALALALFSAVGLTACQDNDKHEHTNNDPVTVISPTEPIVEPTLPISPNVDTSNEIMNHVYHGDFRSALEVVRNNNDYSFESIVYAVENAYESNSFGFAYDFVSLYQETLQSDSRETVINLKTNPIIIAASANKDYYTLFLAMEKMDYTYGDVNLVVDDAYISGANSVASDVISIYERNDVSDSTPYVERLGTNRILINASYNGDFNTVLSAMEKMDYTFSDINNVVENAYKNNGFNDAYDVIQAYEENQISSGYETVVHFNSNNIIKIASDNRDTNTVLSVMEKMPYTFDDIAYAVEKSYEFNNTSAIYDIIDTYKPSLLSDSMNSIDKFGFNKIIRSASDNYDFHSVIKSMETFEYTKGDVQYAIESARSIGFESSAQDILEADKRNDCKLGSINQQINNHQNPFAILNCNNNI